jgi:hypothetical protein
VTPSLRDADLPPLYHVADRNAAAAQQRFFRAVQARLLALIVASAFGALAWLTRTAPFEWAGVAAACCFGASLVLEVFLLRSSPERLWYESRAAAESVKTLSWRYAAGGEPFAVGKAGPPAEELFLAQLNEVLEPLKALDLTAVAVAGVQITEPMRALRAAPLPERRATYDRDRLADQEAWYSNRAAWNSRRSRLWSVALIGFDLLGVVGGILNAVHVLVGDLLALMGAVAAAGTSWMQARQHQSLSTAYTVAALELASVRSKLAQPVDEAAWAGYVADSEQAISREHTLWKASRGQRSV